MGGQEHTVMIIYFGLDAYSGRPSLITEHDQEAAEYLSDAPRGEFRRVFGIEADEFGFVDGVNGLYLEKM
jgi:hypothetical protein